MRQGTIAICAASFAAFMFSAAKAETKTYDFSDFSRVSASAGVDVEVIVGGGFSVQAEGSADAIDQLEIKQSGSKLKIGRDGRLFNFQGRRWRSPLVTVTLPALEGAEASSGADFDARGIDADSFSAEVSSGAELSLEGRCNSLQASASSGAELDAKNLQCNTVDISISTGAEASVYASEGIEASASTGGEVNVSGSPEKQHVSKSLGGDVDIH